MLIGQPHSPWLFLASFLISRCSFLTNALLLPVIAITSLTVSYISYPTSRLDRIVILTGHDDTTACAVFS